MVNDLRMSGGMLAKIWRYDRQLDHAYQQTLKDLRTMQSQRQETEAVTPEPEPEPAAPQTQAHDPEQVIDQPIESPIYRAAEATCLAAVQMQPILPTNQTAPVRTPIGPNLTLVSRVG
jgi:hypothetical protein